MIFILHYILLNAGLPAIIILITLFLHTHSDASLSEIGALLMALPFISIITKPLFCALADRHQAHKKYLMASLALMALGYGSLVVAPVFFPEVVKQHGRLVWYCDIVGVIVGFGAFGIVWSLGDALAVNGAQMAGVSWGSYRLWAVVSWGISGAIISQVNEVPFLPPYVPGMLFLVVSLLVEMVLLAVWPNERFVMCGSGGGVDGAAPTNASAQETAATAVSAAATATATAEAPCSAAHQCGKIGGESLWPAGRSRSGTITESTAGTLNARPRVLGELANALMDDVGESLKSTLRLGTQKSRRKGLDEILTGDSGGFVDNKTKELEEQKGGEERASNEKQVITDSTVTTSRDENSGASVAIPLGQLEAMDKQTQIQRTQLILLKLIVRRDKTILKYLVLFTLFGLLMMCHISYFFMNVRKLCEQRGESFALISGLMLLAHTLSEVTSFLLVARYTALVGRTGALMTCAALYFARFFYYGLGLARLPTYFGIPFEFSHGLSYGIVYSLICEIAIECVDQVDDYLPELLERRLVSPTSKASELKAPLRATMQGVFSGAFDGLGNGMGALFGGVFLDAYSSFERLWQVCAGVSLAIMVIYPLCEWRRARRNEAAQANKIGAS